MLARIQSNESLYSYIERNIICRSGMSDAWSFGTFSKRYLGSNDVEKLANILGLEGCYGFNRLLHQHTHYPRIAIFKNTQDIAYSQSHYFYRNFWVTSVRPKYCPACAQKDLQELGYSYWRRCEHEDVNVCPIHNVVLEDHCFVCGQGFSEKGHGLEVMWHKCGGHHLAECPVQINTDERWLKTSKFIRRIFDFKFHLPEELVVDLVLSKLKPHVLPSLKDKAAKAYDRLGWRKKEIQRTLDINSADFPSDDENILTLLLHYYDDFDSFLDDLNDYSERFNPIDAFWDIYRANKGPVAHYVKERGGNEPHEWFIPFPRPSGYKTRGREARPLVSKIYSCCNF